MTPRISMRARAREVYGEMAETLAPREGLAAGSADPSSPPQSEAAPTPDPSPRLARASGGGEKKAAPGATSAQAVKAEPDLTARARDLYEKSAAPVREIARLCGVTERTIYKYAGKGGWTPRYRRAASDGRGEGSQPAVFAPAKGAGGRFIRRDDIGKPYPTGLKATDPAGRERALVACRRAKSLSCAAQAKAAKEARDAEFLRALAFNALCLGDLRRHRDIYIKGRPPSALQLRIEGLLIGSVAWSTRRLESFLPANAAAPEPAPPAKPEARPVVKPDSKPETKPETKPSPRFDPDDYRAWL